MAQEVPTLQEKQIERDAEALLAEYGRARGVQIEPPVPIEDIVEKYLKLCVEFDDMHRLFGVPRSAPRREPDILGAIFFKERRIVIDESLDPEEYPTKEGRYRFTLAHEGGGHWRLHRNLFISDPAQVSLFDEQTQPAIVCRSSNAKEPIEWQANFYATCLLMPRRLVYRIWGKRFGSDPLIYKVNKTNPAFASRRPTLVFKPEKPNHQVLLTPIVKEFAQVFSVSVLSMRFRLEYLGLLRRYTPADDLFLKQLREGWGLSQR
jgi:hypothetical protein